MNDDLELANLLGEAPRTPDPSFRFDVLARVAARARRQAAIERAWHQIAFFTLLGAVFPIARAFGLTWQTAQPLILAGGVLVLAYFLAALTIQGPKPLLARSRDLFRGI